MIKKLLYTALLIAGILILGASSCEKPFGGYKYEKGSLPTIPVPLSDFNTEYDDYNATAPSLGFLIPFCFSTNRYGFDNDFDIIYEPMNVNFDKNTGVLKVSNSYDNWAVYMDEYEVLNYGLEKMNTSGNEFGPNLIVDYGINEYLFTYMYSSDVTGNSQINFVSNNSTPHFSNPVEVKFLNSDGDDMYPAFNNSRSKIYFCSNRNSSEFDIYYVNVDTSADLEDLLSDTSYYEVYKEDILTSDYDDKCPFIFENTFVFTSNREGGFGGFDLYYSNYKDGNWSEPVNFGPDINTEFDEYRPIMFNEGVSTDQTMMVFSSNRPGGKGGFDLYFVGIATFSILNE